MKRYFVWLVLGGGVLLSIMVLWQAFTIAAYVRGAGEGALDAHAAGAGIAHIGQLAIIIGALVAYWGNWRIVGLTIAFFVLSIGQLVALGDLDEQGGWVNGLHGALALVILLSAIAYALKAARELGVWDWSGRPATTPVVPDELDR
jgi:hypothetical protein